MGKSRADKNRARKARLAAEEQRREAHAQIVAERHNDPRYAQQATDPATGDRVVSLSASHPHAAELAGALAEVRRDFRERFGREMGPNDPLFTDPDAAEPTPVSEEQIDAMWDDVAASTDDPMLRAQLRASKDVGYIITESTMHLFSAHEVDAWEDALDRRLDDD